jgi:Cyclic-phosphate processing Receiver domain
VKVWLDDRRPAPDGWVRVRTPEEAIELLRGGDVDELSLDHDLGLDVGARERTGYDVLLWLEAEVAAGGARPPGVIRVHSGNIGAVGRMERAVESIRRLAGGPR